MFRGFRLQFLALILAAAVCSIALVFRVSQAPQGQSQRPTLPASSGGDATPATASSPAAAQVPATSVPQTSPTDRAIYREGLVGAVQRLNPLFAQLNPVDRDLTSLIFRGLFATDNYGAPVLDLVENLTISGDSLEYVLELRQDVNWQDGVAFSADDVVYTMSLLSDPDYASYSPSAEFWRTVETQKLSDHLLRFRLAQPLASFTRLLTIGILPEHALRGTTVSDLASHPFNLSPIGAGPYQLGELRLDPSGKIGAILLQHAPEYMPRDATQSGYQLRELLFNLYATADEAIQAYRRGEVDVLANLGSRDELLSLPQARLHTSIDSTLQILIFNWRERAFADRRLRRALALSLNQMELVAARLADQAIVADSPLIPGMSVYQFNDSWSAHDSALALSLLETIAGAQSDAEASAETESAETDELTLLVENTDSLPALAFDIAAQWRELGLAFEVVSVGPAELLERLRAGEFAAAIVSQRIGAEPDVYRFWHPAQAGAGQNYGGAAQHEIAELLDAARRTTNGIARQQMYQQFQAIFAEKTIAIPLYYPLYTMVVRDSIEGLRLGFLGSAADRFRGINSWRFAARSNE